MSTTWDKRILVVDDEAALADTLAIIFERAGYIASAVYSCEAALSFVADRQPSLVVSDVVMSGMNGIELARTMRMSYPNCPILLFSGNADTQDLLEAAQQDGLAFEVLAKPVPPLQMLAKVSSLLDQNAPSLEMNIAEKNVLIEK
jgi:CheY-like chemotaxis protein